MELSLCFKGEYYMSSLKQFEITARVNGKLTSAYEWGYNVADAQARFKDKNQGSVSFTSCKEIKSS